MKKLIALSLLISQGLFGQIINEYKSPSGRVYNLGDTIQLVEPTNYSNSTFKSVKNYNNPIWSKSFFEYRYMDYRHQKIGAIKKFKIIGGDTIAIVKGALGTKYNVNIKEGERIGEIYPKGVINSPLEKLFDITYILPMVAEEEKLEIQNYVDEWKFYTFLKIKMYYLQDSESLIEEFEKRKKEWTTEIKKKRTIAMILPIDLDSVSVISLNRNGFGPLINKNYSINKNENEELEKYNIKIVPMESFEFYTFPEKIKQLKTYVQDKPLRNGIDPYLILYFDFEEIDLKGKDVKIYIKIKSAQIWSGLESSIFLGFNK